MKKKQFVFCFVFWRRCASREKRWETEKPVTFSSRKKKETEAHIFFCNASDVEIGLREAMEACGQQTKQPEQVN